MKLSKKLMGKTIKVTWIDPITATRVEAGSIDFAVCETIGEVVFISPCKLILRHETCEELVDETILHPVLIKKLKVV